MQGEIRRAAAAFGALHLLALLLVAAGCGVSAERGGFAGLSASPTSAARRSYTQCDPALLIFCDPNQTITVARGSQFALLLGSSPGTGFGWRIAQPPDAAIVAAPDSGDYEQDPASAGLVPGRGQEIWRFAASGPGRVVIALQYVGPSGAPSLNPYNNLVFVVVVS